MKTKLENPTSYHVRETQLSQAKEYLSQSQEGSNHVMRNALAPRLSAPSGDVMSKYAVYTNLPLTVIVAQPICQ